MFSVLNLICKNYFASLAFVTFAQVVGTTRKYLQKVVLTYLISLVSQPYLVFSFLFFFCHTQGIWTFPGQRSNLNRSCNLHHSWGNAGSFNPLCGAGDQTCVSAAETLPIPLCHSRNSCFGVLKQLFLSGDLRHPGILCNSKNRF